MSISDKRFIIDVVEKVNKIIPDDNNPVIFGEAIREFYIKGRDINNIDVCVNNINTLPSFRTLDSIFREYGIVLNVHKNYEPCIPFPKKIYYLEFGDGISFSEEMYLSFYERTKDHNPYDPSFAECDIDTLYQQKYGNEIFTTLKYPVHEIIENIENGVYIPYNTSFEKAKKLSSQGFNSINKNTFEVRITSNYQRRVLDTSV